MSTAQGLDSKTRPLIWVLKGLRNGDTAQAMALALQLGGRVEGKQLQFNRWAVVPNWLRGAGVGHLSSASRQLLRPPWPDVIVATGRRTATVGLWIKHQSGGHTKIVQIGRPRLPLDHFDMVVTTPQYGLPTASNVARVALPFAIPKSVDAVELQDFAQAWSHLPRPWILAVIGGSKFPLRLNTSDLAQYGTQLSAKTRALCGSVILLDSPRSPKGALQTVAKNISSPLWVAVRGQSPNPYQSALKLCDHLAVTSDSVSMVSEMLQCKKPVWVFRLKRSPFALTWDGSAGPAAILAWQGILHPPRDVNAFIRALIESELVADLNSERPHSGTVATLDEHQMVVERIKRLLKPLA